ncbi:MerR family transcriptional regulator [Victivallis sp. Marseille-Q1083]|uniref:MerR family transcriptional regulator n=1 Tax=Victivallis sp. Marseille-Q1083 TaxID=2717288 RepID=UPI001588812E|nr:MerR family transcriptional regulator [Victivallis sp. Marseille-Q1083]
MTKKTPFEGLTDSTSKYTVKEVADKLGMTTYTVRYYDNAGLIPDVGRTSGNIHMFSDLNLTWFKLIHCLRATGLSIDEIRRYIRMCLEGDATISERAEIIFKQEKVLREQLKMLKKQMEILAYKKVYYQELLAGHTTDSCNPQRQDVTEPNIAPKR